MRPETKLKLARRQHTQELLKWMYSARDAQLDGTRLSMKYRAELGGDTKSLTYGEVDVPDFLSILDLVKPRDGEVFVDLGSGTGKAVLAAACGFPEFSQCRGIELVPGLADAATSHLSTAMTLLTASRESAGKAASTNSTANAKLRGEQSTSLLRGASRKVLGDEGNGMKRTKSKASHQGLSGVEFEALIADLLVRQSLRNGDGNDDTNSEVAPEATAEQVASWLVQDMGHRRYKSSLRGYGGLQKFLVSRREASDSLRRLEISEDGTRVAVAPKEANPHPNGRNSTPKEDGLSTTDEETRRRSHAVTTAGAAAVVAAKVPDDNRAEADDQESLDGTGAVLPSSTCVVEAVSTAASSWTLSPSESCQEPTGLDENRPPVNTVGMTGECGDGDIVGNGVRSESGGNRRGLPPEGPLTVESLSGVELVCGDIFQQPWDDAGVVYVASLLFDDSIMALLAECIQKLRKVARVISLKPVPAVVPSKETSLTGDARLNTRDARVHRGSTGGLVAEGCGGLKLLHEGVFRMSWQMARVYIYKRL